jgi:predicted membrane-bound spermidine synthase
MIVPILFFCSGATALVYEVVWSKYLTLMFGSTVQAQTMVLAVFMGGLALGNRLFGRKSDRAPQPLAWYGYIEVAIGLYAFFFNRIYDAADGLFVALGSGQLDRGWLVLLPKGALSVLLLLGPTVLMGGTLPLLAAWLKRQSTDPGRWSARFYSINSLGAVAGSFLAGFFLVRSLGMVSTLQMTALTNVLVGFAAVGIARMHGDAAPAKDAATIPANQADPEARQIFRAACVLVALTGAISMGLEVLASRSLVLIFGAPLILRCWPRGPAWGAATGTAPVTWRRSV